MAFKLKNDALSIAAREVEFKDVVDIRDATVANLQANAQTDFNLHIQTLVTHLGIIVSDCMETPCLGSESHYCSSAINYLCRSVLENERLYANFEILDVNDNGNDVKHRVGKFNDTNVVAVSAIYNELIDKLVAATGLSVLSSMRLDGEKKSEESPRTSSVAEKSEVAQQRNAFVSSYKKEAEEGSTASVKISCGPIVRLRLRVTQGKYLKGIFKKTAFVGVRLSYSCTDWEFGGDVTAYYMTASSWEEIGKIKRGDTDFNLKSDCIVDGRVTVKFIITYKMSLLKTKEEPEIILTAKIR